ncbi:MAG: molybdenum cofactor guanylyltransferase [Acidobacteriota bacterium]
MSLSTTAAAILAGGRARRFGGRDKARIVIEGRSIIVRQVEILQQVASEIFVVAPDPALFADLGLAVYPDCFPGAGAVGGIYTALERATRDGVLVVACDLPFLSAPLLARLAELAGHDVDGAWISTAAGPEPLLACYQRRARHVVRAAIENGHLKARDLGAALRMAEITGDALHVFGDPEQLLANLNTPADYARIQYRPS